MHGLRTRIVVVVVLAALSPLVALPVRAGGTGSVACGSTSAEWNAPNGAIVLSRSSGPVNGVISALGEYRTHSMISHGNGWATHASMFTPGVNGWPTYCSTPLNANELQNGYPGASQIQQGGIYQYLYGGSLEYVAFQRGCNGAACPSDDGIEVADYIWYAMPYEWWPSRQGSDGIYRIGVGPAGALTNYSLFQYRNLEQVNLGGAAWNNGIICSTLIAYAQYMSGNGVVAAFSYPHNQIVNAINGLLGAVENECNSGIGFWKGVATSITCFEGICDDAARQVANCTALGRCNSDSDGGNSFATVRNDPSTIATAISPDRLGGWSGHPWQGYLEGSGVSAWAADNEQPLQWSSAGNLYGCWF